jgi:hypothetical protein
MAQVGYTPLKLYRSSTASAEPVNTSLNFGELAINYTDGKLFYKDNAGVVQTLASKTAASNTFSGGTTGLTPSSPTAGPVVLAGTLVVGNGGTGLTSLTAGYIPYGAGTSAFGSVSTFKYDTTNSTLNAPTMAVSSTTSVTPTLGFNASNTSFASGATVVGSYLQMLLQNKSGSTGASTNYVLSNDLGTDSTYYGEFGMNASVYSSGTPSNFFGINNGIYFSSHDGDVTVGSGNGYKTYFAFGSSGQSAHVINASGAIGLSTNLGSTPSTTGTTNFGTAGNVLTSAGSGAAPTWGSSTITLGTTATTLGNTFLTLSGLTSISVTQNPTSNLQLATKQYVDTVAATGIHYHTAVSVASPVSAGNLTATYASGGTSTTITTIASGTYITFASGAPAVGTQVTTATANGLTSGTQYWVTEVVGSTVQLSLTYGGAAITGLTDGTGLSIASTLNAGVGATLTNAGTQVALTIDGILTTVGMRVLIFSQTSGTQNGVYTVTTVGTGSTNWVLTRATDANTYSPYSASSLGQGDAFFVSQGTQGAGETWVVSATGSIFFGQTSITFSQISDTGVYTASGGITLTGQNFSITAPLVTTYGGTGILSYTAGDMPYYAAGTALSTLGIGAANTVMTSSGSAPQWSTSLTLSGAITIAGNSTFSSTGALQISKGTTAQQPGTPLTGMMRYNTSTNQFEGYSGASPAWKSIGGSALSNDTASSSNLYPVFASATTGTAENLYTSNAKYLYKPSTGELQASEMVATNGLFVNATTIAASYTIASGYNAQSVGPVTIASGQSVTVTSGQRWLVY